jgi:hypothetical protein
MFIEVNSLFPFLFQVRNQSCRLVGTLGSLGIPRLCRALGSVSLSRACETRAGVRRDMPEGDRHLLVRRQIGL